MVSGTLYTPAKYHKAYRVLLAAKYSKADIKETEYAPGQAQPTGDFAAKFPSTEVPCFQGDDGTSLFEANAIAHFVGNEQLRGEGNKSSVNQWTNYTDTVILPSVATWVYPLLGVGQTNKNEANKAQENVTNIMKFLNNTLKMKTYLVGERITQADLTVFTALQLLFVNVYDENARKPYPHVVRWFTTIANQPEVISVCGKTTLCVKPTQPPKQKQAKEEKPKQKGKEKSESKPAEKPAEAPKPKKENKLAQLPAGKFIMDEWKRMFSNNDLDKTAMPWFWENFEPEHYSLWYCEYKYPEELNLIFQSCNLIGGMFQRLEGMIKLAFGGQHVYGKNKDSQISGVWLWRGTGLIFELSEDLQTDYESYTWRKLDHTKDSDRKIIRDHWAGEGTYHGKECADGKIFK